MKNSFHTLYDQSNETSMRSTQDCFHDLEFLFLKFVHNNKEGQFHHHHYQQQQQQKQHKHYHHIHHIHHHNNHHHHHSKYHHHHHHTYVKNV